MGGRRSVRLLDAQQLFDYAAKLLAARSLSSAEIRGKLRRKAQKQEDIDTVVARLRECGYLNDSRFAQNFAAARKDTQGFGKARVMNDLRRRRVTAAIAEHAVQEAFSGTDEMEMAEAYLRRKFRNTDLHQHLQEEKNLQSAYRRLRYAGFSSGVAIRVLKRYAERADEIEPDFEEPGG
jgi:regulatory protein